MNQLTPLILFALLLTPLAAVHAADAPKSPKPNVVIVFINDRPSGPRARRITTFQVSISKPCVRDRGARTRTFTTHYEIHFPTILKAIS